MQPRLNNIIYAPGEVGTVVGIRADGWVAVKFKVEQCCRPEWLKLAPDSE